jgi:hypothetical protein
VCDELITERRSCVTRIDGIVFMRHRAGKRTEISKYIVSKFGNLKKISSAYIEESIPEEPEGEEIDSTEYEPGDKAALAAVSAGADKTEGSDA